VTDSGGNRQVIAQPGKLIATADPSSSWIAGWPISRVSAGDAIEHLTRDDRRGADRANGADIVLLDVHMAPITACRPRRLQGVQRPLRLRIVTTDRTGTVRAHPLMSVSIGIATTRLRAFASAAAIADAAAEVERAAKCAPGSGFVVDGRRE